MNITSPKEITRLLKENGMSPLKKFGQNFLCDENVVRKIATSKGLEGQPYIFEVGTGLGALTQVLAEHARKVVSLEIDNGLYWLGRETFADAGNVELVQGDILECDIAGISAAYFAGHPFYVCGNLPYYITSKILMRFLESGAPISGMTFMVQKEVAQRLAAPPGSSDYGSLTAACNYYAQPEILFTVGKNCFLPAPDVDSAIIALKMHTPLDVEHKIYSKVVRAAFAMRRKTIYNNLKEAFGAVPAKEALQSADIDPGRRAQELGAQDFVKIARFLQAHGVRGQSI